MGFDVHGDPVQHGMDEFSELDTGYVQMPGACLGIVLSVHHADSDSNMLFRFLRGDEPGQEKASHLEASVLLVYGGTEMYVVLDHVVILPFGKCSSNGPTTGEPADWSEDVPNGCDPKEVDEFFADGARRGVENLSGDWVVVTFVGGLLELPLITNWFSSPRNLTDAPKTEDGKRFTLRRNNSELRIDKNGDLHLTHRVGQYIQMKGKEIVLKHREGQSISLDSEGNISLTNKKGYSLAVDEEGVRATNGEALVEMKGTNVRVYTKSGKVTVNADKVNISAGEVNVTGGSTLNKLCIDDLAVDFQTFFLTYIKFMETVEGVVGKIPGVGTAVEALIKTLRSSLIPIQTKLQTNTYLTYLTKVLKAE